MNRSYQLFSQLQRQDKMSIIATLLSQSRAADGSNELPIGVSKRPSGGGKEKVSSYDLATAYFKDGDYDKAISTYTQAIKENPKQSLWYVDRAVAYEKLSQFDQALADYQTAIKVDPANGEAYFLNGYLYRRSLMLHEAVPYYEKAIALGYDHAREYLDGAKMWLSQGLQGLVIERQRAIETFVSANTFVQVYKAVQKYPLLLDPATGAIKRLRNRVVLPEERASYDEKLEWLYRIDEGETPGCLSLIFG